MALPILKRYLLALKRYKWFGLAGFVGVLGAAGAFAAIQPPPEVSFRSEGALVQNAPVVSFTATGVELQQEGQGIITEDFLLSDILLAEVSRQLGAQGITIEPEDIRRNTGIRIQANEESNQLQQVLVAFNWPNRDEATATLGILFEGMVELSRLTNRSRLGTIITALDERLPAVEAELREAEQALEAYDRLEGPAIQAALDGSLLGAISSSQNQRRQNLVVLAGIDAQMRSLQAQLGMTPEQAYAAAALSADPIIAQLRGQIYQAESQRQLLSATLRPAHPTMEQLDQDLEGYRQLLSARAQEVIAGGNLAVSADVETVRRVSSLDPTRSQQANQLVGLQTQRDSILQQQQILAQSEEQLRQQYSSLPNKQLERDRLAQQVALKRALYDQIQAKRIDAQSAEAETVSSLTVASPPATKRVETESMSSILILLGGAAVGLVAGGALVFLLDMLDGTVRIYEDVEKLLVDQDLPLLGVVPTIETHSQHIPPLILAADSAYGDLYERIRSNLQLVGTQVNDGKIPHAVLITSTRDQEGKTITAFNLGIAAARAGRRTLVLEMDLRSPSRGDLLGLTVDPQAALEPLRYYAGHLDDPVQMVPEVENLYVSLSPGPQRNPAMIVDSSEMARFLADARARFDFIILDAPHLSGSNDTMLLTSRTDGLVLVARPNYTEKAVIRTALEQFEESEELTLLGVVINGADISVQSAQAVEPPVDPEPASTHPEMDPVPDYPPRQPASAPIDF
ncbi:MAG: cobalamin biosynthesis protein CobQ [Cyanobacteria bacterium]|nr:cobalamin biosynthesis protein CobQ [Cyanobacteriota bacterium]